MRRSNFVPTKIFARFSRLIEGYCRSKLKPGSDAELFMSRAQYIVIERIQMTSRRPYWCSKTMHETAAILLFQTNPVGFGPFFCHSIWKDSVVQFAQPFQLEISTREASMERL